MYFECSPFTNNVGPVYCGDVGVIGGGGVYGKLPIEPIAAERRCKGTRKVRCGSGPGELLVLVRRNWRVERFYDCG